jgi:hypothetical protein
MEEEKKKIILENIEAFNADYKLIREIIEKHENIRERTVRYVYQLITAIGVVAGFGFTAVSSIGFIFPFIIGESLLFSAMAVGMWFVKKAFIDEAKVYANYIDKLGKIMEEREAITLENDTLENIKVKTGALKNREGGLFDDPPLDIKSDIAFKRIFYLFIVGGVFLLLSFLGKLSCISK